jgi:hypothetical protein
MSLLPISRIPQIREALEESLPAPAHLDFYLSALDHLQRGQFRHAVLEAVISLEIASTSYIRECMGGSGALGKLTKKHILKPQVGLSRYESDQLAKRNHACDWAATL